MTTTLHDIESAAKKLRDSRDALSAAVDALQAKIQLAERNSLPLIKRCVSICAERQAELKTLIDAARHLFVKPRTQVLHGIKCGLAKGKGAIEIADEARTIRLIEDKLPVAMHEVLIKTEKTIIKKALSQFPVDVLKKLGCNVEETGDYILIKFTDSAVDKAVKALLKDAIDDATQQAA